MLPLISAGDALRLNSTPLWKFNPLISSGDVKTLLDDIQELKPTVFPAVPRVLNKVYDKVNAQLDAKPFVVKVSWFVSYSVCQKARLSVSQSVINSIYQSVTQSANQSTDHSLYK